MKEINKAYAMSNADLCMLASNMVVFMTRDAVEYAARGVDALTITAFETLGNAFELFPPDEYYKAAVSGEVALKNTARSNASDKIQLISGYFEQLWGLDDFHYKQLRIKGFHLMSDNNFLVTCRNVVTVATEYIIDLTAIGLTQADVDSLETEAQLFEDKLNTIAQKKALRDDEAEERTIKGNELYSYAKKYSTIGKLIWENVDESKYNDYIIYKTAASGMGKVKDLAYDVPTKMASWDALQLADTYQLEYKPPYVGSDWEVIYEDTATQAYYDSGVLSMILRCRGHNAEGYGDWSDELSVVIPT